MSGSRGDEAPSSQNDLSSLGAENGTLLWTPQSLKPCPLEILARSAKDDLSSVLKPRMVVCTCQAESQCLYNQNDRVGNSSLEVSVGEGGRSVSVLREGKWELKGCCHSAPLS